MNNKELFKLPENLEPEVKEYMARVLQMLEDNEIIDTVDTFSFKMLAQNYNTFIKANKIVDEEGMISLNSKGQPIPHPAVRIAKEAQVAALKIMADYGLTAKSRTKLPKLASQTGEESPLEAFVKQNKK